MSQRPHLAQAFGQRVRRSLAHPSRAGRRPVSSDGCGSGRRPDRYVLPLLVAADRRQRLLRDADLSDPARAAVSGTPSTTTQSATPDLRSSLGWVRHPPEPWVFRLGGATRPGSTRKRATSAMRCTVADSPMRWRRRVSPCLPAELIEALERQAEVGPALVGQHGVHFVDDHRAHRRESPGASFLPSGTDTATRGGHQGCAAGGEPSQAFMRAVSPVRSPTRICGRDRGPGPRPPLLARQAASWFLRTSLDSALSGEMYKTEV